MSKLQLASDFALPLDVAGEALSILATRGAGKSFTAAVIVEELFSAEVQVVVIDPTGVFWGLRGSGEKEGLPIYVFGGQHGDLPLEATAGELIADLAVENEHSFVLDLSNLDTKRQQTRFMRAFAERLYRRKAQHRSTLHLVIDEADEVCPQRPLGKDEPFLLGAMEAIVRRGRSRGLGVTLITQRSAALNKNVLALSDTLLVLRTTSPQDRKAIDDWIRHHHLADELGVLDTLPALRTGTAWVWSPVRDILKQIEIRHIRTFDSYRSPKPGETPKQPRRMAEIDLEELGRRMSATVERARAADPRNLRKRIEELEAQLRKRPVETTFEQVPVEVPVLSGSEIDDLESVVQQMRDAASQAVAPIIAKADEILFAISERKLTDSRIVREVKSQRGVELTRPRPLTEPKAGAITVNGFEPSNSQKKVLDAIAWLESMSLEADRTRVGFLAGYTQSSGHFSNMLSKLNTAGVIAYPRPGAVALTDTGKQLATYPREALTTSDVHERVMSKLQPVQQRVLQAILDVYPEDISRAELAEKTGYEAGSGHFSNLISSLSKLGVIARAGAGFVRAEDLLFIG